MKKQNNSLLFVSGFLLLGVIVTGVLKKYLPLLLLQSVYYCQTVMHVFIMKIPNRIGQSVILLFLISALILVVKLVILCSKMVLLQKRLSKNQVRWPSADSLLRKLRISDRTNFVQDDRPYAFCFGLCQPRIYISTKTAELMTKKELEAILLHEKYHVIHKDSLTMVIATITTFIFPFFPLFSDLLNRYKVQREINADAFAIEKIGKSEPLISVLKKLLLSSPQQRLPVAAIAEYATLEFRIEALVASRSSGPRFRPWKVLLSLCSLLLLLGSIITPVQAVEMHTSLTDTTMVCLQNNDCIKGCKKKNNSIQFTVVNKIKENVSRVYTPTQ